MAGTLLALQVLLTGSPGGPPTVAVDGAARHVFDCFAMANATLCSLVGPDVSGQGKALLH